MGLGRRGFLGGVAAAAAAWPAWARGFRAPRTRFGAPDLEGVWTNASYTRFERPKLFKALVISPEEAAKAEALHARTGSFSGVDDPLGQVESEFREVGGGLARVRGDIRTSWIVDPADGRLPFTPEAIKRFRLDDPDYEPGLDNPEDRAVTERCVASEGGAPPNLPSPDGNFLQIVQTRDHVALHAEKYHDVRIVRLHDREHAPAAVQSWLGDPVGWYEGDTLVIESVNLWPSTPDRSYRMMISPKARIVERFTRVAAGRAVLRVQRHRSGILHPDLPRRDAVPRHQGPDLRIHLP